ELAMNRGAQAATAKEMTGVAAENAQLKEEAAFLRQLVADANQKPGVSIPRLAFDQQGDSVWRFSMLVVRGGNPRDEFGGRLVLEATLQSADPAASTTLLSLPDDEPQTAPLLKLAFKVYQRVEGTFRVPAGTRVVALDAHVFESGVASARASRLASAS